LGVQAPGHCTHGCGTGGDTWISVSIDPGCKSEPAAGSWYLFNFDKNSDGTLDYAAFLFESYDFRVSAEPIQMYMISPARNLYKWAMVWYGYSADGSCAIDDWGIVHWNLKMERSSYYQIYNIARAEFRVELTVGPGDQLVVEENVGPNQGQQYTITVGDSWFTSSGAWLGQVSPGYEFGGTYSAIGQWSYSTLDFAEQIQSFGHPYLPWYTLAQRSISQYLKGTLLLSVNPSAEGKLSMSGFPAGSPEYTNEGFWYPYMFIECAFDAK